MENLLLFGLLVLVVIWVGVLIFSQTNKVKNLQQEVARLTNHNIKRESEGRSNIPPKPQPPPPPPPKRRETVHLAPTPYIRSSSHHSDRTPPYDNTLADMVNTYVVLQSMTDNYDTPVEINNTESYVDNSPVEIDRTEPDVDDSPVDTDCGSSDSCDGD